MRDELAPFHPTPQRQWYPTSKLVGSSLARMSQQHKSSRSDLLVQPAENAGLARLRSFSATTWFGKPPALSAQAAAAKGWTNTGPDQLSCLSCGSQILCKLPLNPWSEAAAGIVAKYSQRLVDAHSPQCRQRSLLGLGVEQQPPSAAAAPRPSRSSSTSVAFPIIPAKKLSTAYYARLQELQELQSLPDVSVSTRARLAAAAARLDPSILTGLAALLHMPLDTLKHEAAAAVVAPGSTSSSTTPAAPHTNLSREQAQVLTALCGWQPRQLLPPQLAPTAAADAGGALFGVPHLLPSRRSSQAGQHSTPPAGQPQPAAAAAAGSSVSPACTALECELCGICVGLWRFSCSGPFFAQQLSSKAMRALTTAAAAAAAPSSSQPPSEAAAAAAAGERSSNGTPARMAATDQNPTSPSPAAGDARSREQQLTHAPSGSAAAAGSLSPTAQQAQQQQQQQQAGEVVASASPEAVFSTLTHTIAGGSLLTAGASGGRPFGAAVTQPAFGLPAGFGRTGRPPMQQQQQQQQTPPAAEGAATAGGSSSGGGSKLFEGLAGVPAGANVFGSPPPAAAVGAAGGPFGGSGGGGSSSRQAAPAPVFGLQAFEEEEQRAKRRRSSSAAGPDFAAAAAAAVAAHTAGGPNATHDPAAAAAVAGGQRPVTPETQATSPPAAAAGAAGGSSGGSGAGRAVRRFSKQRSGLVAAVAGATGEAPVGDTGALFDPIDAHRRWCPWVKDSSSAPAAAGGSGSGSSGLVAAVRLGWAATLMAVQEDEEQQELTALVQQQQQSEGGGGGAGLLPQRDDYSSTAAVLARARQAMELMEGLP